MVVARTSGVRQKSSMGERVPFSSRSALRRAGVGEIVEVQGGHIVRATSQKDRHSKVCTAKGTRDRRVRLAAHTAIQFYDVQDRLGYDRPSKAVDWLIKNAKSAIDELDQLPAWTPTSVNVSTAGRRKGKASGGGKVVELGEHGGGGEGVYGDSSGASLLPPSLNSDAIADTIKSFFPAGGGTSLTGTRPEMQFEGYAHGGVGGGIRQREDLNLSLQSFQAHDPILMHSQHGTSSAHHDEQQHSVFGGAVPNGFENPNVGWADSQHQPSPELGQLHRLLVGWQNQQHNTNIDQHHYSGGHGVSLATGGGASGGGFMFNQPSLLQPFFGSHHGQYFTQRGPLQSSNSPSVLAWISDPSIATASEQHLHAIPVHPQGFPSLVYPSGGFSGFHIPARIQGEEEHDGDLNPSSASSGSHH